MRPPPGRGGAAPRPPGARCAPRPPWLPRRLPARAARAWCTRSIGREPGVSTDGRAPGWRRGPHWLRRMASTRPGRGPRRRHGTPPAPARVGRRPPDVPVRRSARARAPGPGAGRGGTRRWAAPAPAAPRRVASPAPRPPLSVPPPASGAASRPVGGAAGRGMGVRPGGRGAASRRKSQVAGAPVEARVLQGVQEQEVGELGTDRARSSVLWRCTRPYTGCPPKASRPVTAPRQRRDR